MTDSVQEQLLGHLLGALDDPEHDAVAARVQEDPQVRVQWERLAEQVRPLAAVERDVDPPPGLAEMTCRLVALEAAREGRETALRAASPAAEVPRRKYMSPADAPPKPAGRMRWLDLAVAAGFLLAASLVIVPAIQNSRSQSRVTACQNNLGQIGGWLTQYSELNGGRFPEVPAEGKLAAAGAYAPTLLSANLLPEPSRLLCPGSPLADRRQFTPPTIEEVQAASGRRLLVLRQTMGGSYGYSFGHMRDKIYRATRNLRRAGFAIMADAPDLAQPNLFSLHHDGRGLNFLFEDNAVRFLSTACLVEGADDPFTNDRSEIAAGLHPDDAVIAPSSAAPIVYVDYR